MKDVQTLAELDELDWEVRLPDDFSKLEPSEIVKQARHFIEQHNDVKLSGEALEVFSLMAEDYYTANI